MSFFRGTKLGVAVGTVTPFFCVRFPPEGGKAQGQGIRYAAMPPEILRVPFESQRDNTSGTGWRECFSSSAAMLARYWGATPSDDAYNAIRAKYGDTTEAAAQVRALRALGLRSDFWTCGARVDLEHEIKGGRPVAVGWLHKGGIRKPTGGHWSVVVGFDSHCLWMHDPNGEPLLASGGHIPGSNGANVKCTWANFLPRWEVEGSRTGWYLTCAPGAYRVSAA